jgi:deoxyribodipyrimidine photo-lyase
MRAIFLFHCDLRLIDNTSLNQAIRDGYTILPIFIFTPEQIEPSQNAYFSHSAVQFMCESLKELPHVKLFKGDTLTILTKIYADMPFDAIYFNTSYSVYAQARDASIEAFCKARTIKCVSLEDYGLLPLMEGLVAPEKPYTVFAPFYRKVMTLPIRAASKSKPPDNAFIDIAFDYEYSMTQIDTLYTPNETAKIRGGRKNGKKLLKNRLKTLIDYQNERDFPATQKTSLASPHIKFGTISIREMYHTILKLFGKEHGLVRELIFREFYLKIYTLLPDLQRGIAYTPLQIEWINDTTALEKWKTGTTGFPLVDAGMRELNTTGHQHNRVRMLCANFLTKYLLIDWRIGMQYFYTKLVDADIFSNTAGWQWASSTGPSAIEYWRPPFNPYIQSKKFDNDGLYIKQWVPELENVAPKDIHNWHNPKIRAKYPNIYLAPIIEHTVASKRAVQVYKGALHVTHDSPLDFKKK